MICVVTRSPEETRMLAETVGSALTAPMVFELSGDLGSGKTVFVKGLARGLDIPGETEVTSPSFSLIHEHKGRFTLFHVDLYRLDQKTDLEALGLEEIINSRAVVAVEWSEKIPAGYTADHIHVRFAISSDNERCIEMLPEGAEASKFLQTIKEKIEAPR